VCAQYHPLFGDVPLCSRARNLSIFRSLFCLLSLAMAAASAAPASSRRETGSRVQDAMRRVPLFSVDTLYAFCGHHADAVVRPFFQPTMHVSDGRYVSAPHDVVAVRFATASVHGTTDRQVTLYFDASGPSRAECSCPHGYAARCVFRFLWRSRAPQWRGLAEVRAHLCRSLASAPHESARGASP
jgi:hypothetical protein